MVAYSFWRTGVASDAPSPSSDQTIPFVVMFVAGANAPVSSIDLPEASVRFAASMPFGGAMVRLVAPR